MAQSYWKAAIWEYPLCVICAAALAYTLVQGFFLPEALAESAAPTVLLQLAVQAAFFLFGYSRRTAAAGVCCWMAAVSATVLWARSAPDGIPLWLVLQAVPAAAVYLLSRSRVGCGVLFLLGSFLCAAFAFLQYAAEPVALLLFLWAVLCLSGYRAYRRSVLTGSAAKSAFPAAFLTSAAACILMLSLAVGLYGAVIRPLAPPTRELKLVTRLMSLEVLERLGVSTHVHLFDETKFSGETGEEERISSTEGDVPQQGPSEDLPVPLPLESGENTRQEQSNGPEGAQASAISYLNKPVLALLLPVLAGLAAAGAVLLKRLSRKAWRRRVERLSRGEQLVLLYPAMLRKLRRFGLPPLGADTPCEYAARTERQLERLLGRENGFSALTDSYVRFFYGLLPPEPEELCRCWSFYERFYPRVKRSVGSFRYARQFFFI